MKFNKLTIGGAFIINLEPKTDDRGFLARSFCKDEFAKAGIHVDLVQGYTCKTYQKGTLRGLHRLLPPFSETKVTRVTQGKLYEIILDLRTDSPTYKKWEGITVSADEYKLIVIPAGCAHAVLTLEDNTEYYSMYNKAYDLAHEAGVRFNDPAFNIKWPVPIQTISEKDKSWPDYKE